VIHGSKVFVCGGNVCVIHGGKISVSRTGKIFVSCTGKIFVCGGNVRENVATLAFFTNEERSERRD
jgi:hypothetical protein